MSEYDEAKQGLVSLVATHPHFLAVADAAIVAIEALVKERDDAKRKLFPYAEDKEISGVTWNGFYLIGNRKSVDEFNRLENRAAQLEVYRAEFVRRNEAAEAEVERLKGVLGDIKRNADCGGDPGLFRWQTLSEITKALEAKP